MTTILLVQYWGHIREQVLRNLDNEEMLSWVVVLWKRSTIPLERRKEVALEW